MASKGPNGVPASLNRLALADSRDTSHIRDKVKVLIIGRRGMLSGNLTQFLDRVQVYDIAGIDLEGIDVTETRLI